MGCCNERGVLRPLLSGSAASSRHGHSSSSNNAGVSNNDLRYSRNKRHRKGNKSQRINGSINKGAIGLSHQRNGYDGMTSEHFDDDDYDDEFGDEEEDRSCAYWCQVIVTMLQKIGLLVWKNLLLRRRHYIVTTLEILLPTLCAALLALGKTQTGGSDPNHQDLSFTAGTGNESIVFPAVPEDKLILALKLKNACRNCYFAYAPQNAKTDLVIGQLEAVLQFPNTQFKGYQSEGEIEKLVAGLNFNASDRGLFRGAVVFENGLNEQGGRIAYKIRLVDEFHDTGTLFPVFQLPGPNIEHTTKYIDSGFIGLQLALDKVLASSVANQKVEYSVSLQPFPYPPFSINFDFSMFYFILLPTLFVVGFIFMVPSIVRVVVSEKDSGIRELLKLNGLPGWMQWLGWMVNSMLIMMISITIVVFFLFWTFKIESGAVLVYSDPSVWWVILFLYTLSASSFCFFVSSFPLKPTLATTVGIILWLGSYFFIFPRMEQKYQMASFTEKLGVALLPNLALHLAVKVMCAFEGKAVGAQWRNIAEPLSSVDPLTLGHVILMFLVNTTLYMFLTVYIENVFPSEYGVRKPWYYLFQARTWFPRRSSVDRIANADETDFDQNIPGFEKQTSDSNVGVEIMNLRKTFGRNKVAVNGVSARMYDGEIFALLGHNGAGKTTTISMLTGLFAPSGGTATVNGYDITTDLDSVRQNMGLCAQHNLLFDKLTVSEHLRFFGQLKGLSLAEATKESKEILKKLQLSDKETTLSMALSGGQKRKLSLGIALIGGTKVVILDEPTSGMDPEARRAIWDLLLEMRGQRTILLTTHFMEEADVLGDRIGIMANGKLQCCGTPIFLKKYYGTGYSLKVSLNQSEKRDELLRCVQRYVFNASIKSIHNNNSSELILSLPTETATTDKLSEMFSELTEYKAKLGIKTIGLSLTTMDEVFLRVGELTEDHANANVENGVTSTDSPDASQRVNDERSNLKSDHERALGLKLVKEQFMALLVKKYIYTIRKRKLMLSQLLMPIAILALTIMASNANFETPDPPPALKITLDSYKNPVTLYSSTDENMASAMASVIGPSAQKVPSGTTVFQTISDLGRNDLASYRERHIIAGDATPNNYTAMFNTIPNHAAPVAINIATNSILRKLDPSSSSRIYVTNHPFQSRMESLLEAAKPDPIFAQTVPIMFAVFMPIGLALLAASFIVFPIEERLCKAKQLQMMTGVSPLTYWSSAFAWDFFVVVLVICAMTLCFPIFQSHNVFTSYGGAGVAFLILLIYGYSAISFSYVISLFSSTVAGGFAFVSILHVASGMILCIVVHVMEIGELLGLAEKLRWIGRFFPTFGAAISTMRYSEIASKNGRCNILSDEAKQLICDPSTTTVPKEYRECCDNCHELDTTCFEPTPYITWNYTKGGITTSTVPGIGQELLYMVIMGIIYQVILLLLEYGIIQKALSKLFQTDESVFKSEIYDEDVREESERVSNLVASGRTNEDALIVDNFCKSYGSFAAVSRLSFGVHHGECFGLLGVNGAGKTTTFRMLTGDEYRSHGNAYAFMNTLEKNRKQFLGNIGYCPQFDGIIDVLSGREMLQLFCRLRGVPGRYGQKEADKWLTKLGLHESAGVQCRKYSGGMKRRLSVAMAMIGDPPILLLDEPTSGVDPVSRRQFWQVLGAVRDSGQSIILTSHSMEECEALCTRLGIMVNGQLQCLGGVQHLKSKFAQGYSLSLKLKPIVPLESEDLNKLSHEISQKFAPCTLKDKHQNILQYQVQNTTIPWNVLFKNMEDLKTRYDDIIEDYAVNETTLEEVFLSFARKQYGNRKADVSLIRRIVTCQLC